MISDYAVSAPCRRHLLIAGTPCFPNVRSKAPSEAAQGSSVITSVATHSLEVNDVWSERLWR